MLRDEYTQCSHELSVELRQKSNGKEISKQIEYLSTNININHLKLVRDRYR